MMITAVRVCQGSPVSCSPHAVRHVVGTATCSPSWFKVKWSDVDISKRKSKYLRAVCDITSTQKVPEMKHVTGNKAFTLKVC